MGWIIRMHMIAALTPEQKIVQSVSRHKMTELNVVEKSKVTIIDYRFARQICRDITFAELLSLTECDKSIALGPSTSNWPHQFGRG